MRDRSRIANPAWLAAGFVTVASILCSLWLALRPPRTHAMHLRPGEGPLHLPPEDTILLPGEVHSDVAAAEPRRDATTHDLAQCEERTARLAARAAELRRGVRGRLPAARAYALGAPNEQTDHLLRPVVERLLRGDGGPPNFSLECHDEVCQLTLLDLDSTRGAALKAALQSDRELRSRVRGVSFAPEVKSADLLGQAEVGEEHIYLRLTDSDLPTH